VATAAVPMATAPTATSVSRRREKRLNPSLMPVSPTCVRGTPEPGSGVAVAAGKPCHDAPKGYPGTTR
jgi:hypothetical protein